MKLAVGACFLECGFRKTERKRQNSRNSRDKLSWLAVVAFALLPLR